MERCSQNPSRDLFFKDKSNYWCGRNTYGSMPAVQGQCQSLVGKCGPQEKRSNKMNTFFLENSIVSYNLEGTLKNKSV